MTNEHQSKLRRFPTQQEREARNLAPTQQILKSMKDGTFDPNSPEAQEALKLLGRLLRHESKRTKFPDIP